MAMHYSISEKSAENKSFFTDIYLFLQYSKIFLSELINVASLKLFIKKIQLLADVSICCSALLISMNCYKVV